VPPTWGWITDRPAWRRIGAHKVSATDGTTSLVAEVRCLDCDLLRAGRQIFHGDSFTRWLAPSALDKLEWAPADLPAVETIRSALLRGSGGTA